MDNLFPILLLGAIIVTITVIVWRANRHERQIDTFIADARRTKPLFCAGSAWYKVHFQLVQIGADETRRQRCVLVVSEKHLAVYTLEDGGIQRRFAGVPADLRWFGRPQKYHYGLNEIWLHYEVGQDWFLLKLDMHIKRMQGLVRTLKAIAADDLVVAYRRQRPYIHHGPIPAYPATQDIHGAWALAAPVALYIMPTRLVILENSSVSRAIPVREIAEIERVRRADVAKRGGLVRFIALGESLAYALDDDEAFAQQLATTAKADLEEISRKRKTPEEV